MYKASVKVIDAEGNTLGEVSGAATSVQAAKIAGGPVQYARYNGVYVWKKTESSCVLKPNKLRG